MNVLAVFAKEPKPGTVKSRLAAATSPAWAACVAEAFLLDWIAKLKDFPAERVLVYSPSQAQAYFDGLTKEFETEPQADGDLGVRMKTFLTRRLAGGAEKIVIIGTDSPTLPLDYVHQAFAGLDQADVVIGPAEDGGYYLIGCARGVPNVFDGIDWGKATVLEQTLAHLRASNARFTLLPSWYDVDTFDDWQRLRREWGDRPSTAQLSHILKPAQDDAR